MTFNNITSGFKATGLFPFNPDIIPEEAFAPSTLTEKPLPEVNLIMKNEENIPEVMPSTSKDIAKTKKNILPYCLFY